VDPIELLRRLSIGTEFPSRHIEGPRGPSLVDRDIDATDPRTILANMRNEIVAAIDHRGVHRLADVTRPRRRGRNDGLPSANVRTELMSIDSRSVQFNAMLWGAAG